MEYLACILTYTPVAQQATIFQVDTFGQVCIEAEHTRYYLENRDLLKDELCVLQTLAQDKGKMGVVIYVPKEPTPMTPTPEAVMTALQTLYQEHKLKTTVLICPEPEPQYLTPTSHYVSQLLDRLLFRMPARPVNLEDLDALFEECDMEALERNLAPEIPEGA